MAARGLERCSGREREGATLDDDQPVLDRAVSSATRTTSGCPPRKIRQHGRGRVIMRSGAPAHVRSQAPARQTASRPTIDQHPVKDQELAGRGGRTDSRRFVELFGARQHARDQLAAARCVASRAAPAGAAPVSRTCDSSAQGRVEGSAAQALERPPPAPRAAPAAAALPASAASPPPRAAARPCPPAPAPGDPRAGSATRSAGAGAAAGSAAPGAGGRSTPPGASASDDEGILAVEHAAAVRDVHELHGESRGRRSELALEHEHRRDAGPQRGQSAAARAVCRCARRRRCAAPEAGSHRTSPASAPRPRCRTARRLAASVPAP